MTEDHAIRTVEVDANEEYVRDTADRLMRGLLARDGEASTIGILLEASRLMLEAMLHTPSPSVESNIAGITHLLDALKAAVLGHVDCARQISADAGIEQIVVTPKGQVH